MTYQKFSTYWSNSYWDEDEYTWYTMNDQQGVMDIGQGLTAMNHLSGSWNSLEIVTLDDFFWIPGGSMRFIAMSLDVKINWFIFVSDFGVLVIGPWSTWCTGLNSVVHVYSRVNQKNNFYPVKTNSSCCSLTPDWCPHTHYR